ncbi:hypothetical protein GCM10009619_18960 [Williamsia maris]
MGMHYEELDALTREFMIAAFEEEESSGNPYRGRQLSSLGRQRWPDAMRRAITAGDDDSLMHEISKPELWLAVSNNRRVNLRNAASQLAVSEFNTWYVRGLTARLISEGVDTCEVYRAAPPRYSIAACASHEGVEFSCLELFGSHRSRYWPIEDASAFAIPFQPGCHHSVRRLGAR